VIRRQVLAAACSALAGCAELLAESPPTPAPAAPPSPAWPAQPIPDADTPPPAPREFRAAWVASVANIDWPSRPGLSAEAQRAEALAMLERARAVGLNALILQVRPAGDALYASTLEPWSEVLSGEQGRAPWKVGEAAWDPLAFWVREAHRRGLELHAWFNPYRARHSSAGTPLVAPHLAVRRPELVKRYGDMLWMDPGEPAAAAHTLAVVADVVRRYDVDGVHIDDYFYPYPFSVPAAGGVEQPFPDDESYARYRQGGGLLVREDWRRAHIDALVAELYRSVHAIKPWVKVGVSPFGLGRPGLRPAGITGFDQFGKLYADVERWLDRGWLDYLAPQLYWPINSVGQPFAPLLDYWLAENRAHRHVWPGLFTSQVTRGEPGVALGPRVWPAREVLDQVALVRSRPGAGGHIHFSMVALMQDRDGIATQLQAGPYAQAALVPATPWLPGSALPAPLLTRRGAQLEIAPGPGPAPTLWALWQRVGGQWRFAVLPGEQRRFEPAAADLLTLSAVDRVGNLGATQRMAWQ
jgi:uncharacterized lipoprotein YddW (UPF0748 family)